MEHQIQGLRVEELKRLAQENSDHLFNFGASPPRIIPNIERAGGTPGAYETAAGCESAPGTPSGPEGHEPFPWFGGD